MTTSADTAKLRCAGKSRIERAAHECLSYENDSAGRRGQSGQLGADAGPLSKVWCRSASNSTPTARSRRQHFSRGLAIPLHQRRVRVAWNRAHETDDIQKLLGTDVALRLQLERRSRFMDCARTPLANYHAPARPNHHLPSRAIGARYCRRQYKGARESLVNAPAFDPRRYPD